MAAVSKHAAWIDCHEKTVDLLIVNGAFDELSREHLNDEAKFLKVILEAPKTNFALAPSTERGDLHCLHHCSVCEDDIARWWPDCHAFPANHTLVHLELPNSSQNATRTT